MFFASMVVLHKSLSKIWEVIVVYGPADHFAFHELHRLGACFTWNNRQASLVRSVLDRVFVCNDWDYIFPRASLVAPAHIGSDHTPLFLGSGDLFVSLSRRFQFDSSWLLVEVFVPLVMSRISSLLGSVPRSSGPVDDWSFWVKNHRNFLRAGVGIAGRLRVRIKIPCWGRLNP